MEVTVNHLGAVQFEIKARQHTIVSDQPAEGHGFDEGMTPPELFLASLGACAAYYVADFLRQKNLATEGTRVRVVADKVMNPPRIDNIRIEVELPLALEERQPRRRRSRRPPLPDPQHADEPAEDRDRGARTRGRLGIPVSGDAALLPAPAPGAPHLWEPPASPYK